MMRAAKKHYLPAACSSAFAAHEAVRERLPLTNILMRAMRDVLFSTSPSPFHYHALRFAAPDADFDSQLCLS